MIKLLKNANVYAPEKLGKKDILIEGEKILLMQDSIEGYEGLPGVETYDLEGKIVVPAYIDMHVHITGGGGEQGPASRVPESQLSEFFKNGITTVVGLLGTDGVTRSVENLIAKARALTEEGMTVYTLTSSYGYPPTTLTGSVERDIILVPPMIGVKVAVSDHRSSNPGGEELIALATAARRAGLLSNTPGLVTMHMGDGEGRLDPVFYVLDHSDVPAKNLLPTHILRNPGLIDAGADLVRRGGYIDCTAGADDVEVESDAMKLFELLHREGVKLDHVTMSSDAFGSQPRFNEEGECIGLTYASPKYLHRTIQILVREGMPLEDALQLLTSTPAVLLGQEGVKGCVAEGAVPSSCPEQSQVRPGAGTGGLCAFMPQETTRGQNPLYWLFLSLIPPSDSQLLQNTIPGILHRSSTTILTLIFWVQTNSIRHWKISGSPVW